MNKPLFFSLLTFCCSFMMILSFDDEELSQMLQDPEFLAFLNSTVNEDFNDQQLLPELGQHNNCINLDIYHQFSSRLMPMLPDEKKKPSDETLDFISKVLKKFDKDVPWNFRDGGFAIYEKFQQWLQEGIWYSLHYKFSRCERLSSEDTKLLSLLKKILAYDEFMHKVIDPQPATMMELSSSSDAEVLPVASNLLTNIPVEQEIFVFHDPIDTIPIPSNRTNLTIDAIPQKYKDSGSNLAQLLPKKKVAHSNELPLHDFISVVLCGFDTDTWEKWSKKFKLQRRFNEWIRLGTWKTLYDIVNNLNESSSSNNNDIAWELPILKKILNHKKNLPRLGHNIRDTLNSGLEFPSFPSSHMTPSLFTHQDIQQDHQDFGILVPHSSEQELLSLGEEPVNSQQWLMPLRASTDTSIRYSEPHVQTIDLPLPPQNTVTNLTEEESLLEFLAKELETATEQSSDILPIEINAVPDKYKYWGEELAKLAQLRKTSPKKMSASDFISIVLWKFDTKTWIGQYKPGLLAKRFERWIDDGTWKELYKNLENRSSSSHDKSNENSGRVLSLLKEIIDYKKRDLTPSHYNKQQASIFDDESTLSTSTQITTPTNALTKIVEEQSLIEFLAQEFEESTTQSVPTQMTASVVIQTEAPPLTFDLASPNIFEEAALTTPLPLFTNEATQHPLFQFHEQDPDESAAQSSNIETEDQVGVPQKYKVLGEKLAKFVPQRNFSATQMKGSVFISIVLWKFDTTGWSGLVKAIRERFKIWSQNGYWQAIYKKTLRKKEDASSSDFVSESEWSLLEKIIKKKNEFTKPDFKIQRAASFDPAQSKFVSMRPPSIFSNQTVQTSHTAQTDSQKWLSTILLPDSAEREPLFLAMPEKTRSIDIKNHKALAEQLMAVVKILQAETTSAAKSRIDFIAHILWKFDQGKSIRWEDMPQGTKLYRTFCEWHKNKTAQRKITWNEIYEQFYAQVTNDEHAATEDENKILLLLKDIINFDRHKRKPMDG